MSDALPRRNLGLSEPWGRSLEGRVASVAEKLGIEVQGLHGLGRYSASSAGEFGRNARKVEAALLALPYYFSEGGSSATPSVTTAWSTIVSLTLAVPEDKPILDVLVTANSTLDYPAGGSTTVTQFSWPFSLDLVTSEYGPRDTGFHEGIDFAGGAASSGNPIPAAGDGVVAESVTGHPGWGNYVRLEHDVDGTMMSTLYAHMIATPSVDVSDTVTRGQTLGYVGDTGNSFGAHLHFETWTGTEFGSHADPRWFMDMYGEDGTTTPPPSAPLLRLTVDGVSSLEFAGLISTTLPLTLTFVPVFGRSFAPAGTTVTITLDAISGGAVTGSAATLAVTGSFHA